VQAVRRIANPMQNDAAGEMFCQPALEQHACFTVKVFQVVRCVVFDEPMRADCLEQLRLYFC
jgi:hypothetical protein